MKFEVRFKKNGKEMFNVVDAYHTYDAVDEIYSKHSRSCLFFKNDIEIMEVYSVASIPNRYHCCLQLGETYQTNENEYVTMKGISNSGKEYETMYDQHGVHRYSRSPSRIIGRCTGSSVYEPKNISLKSTIHEWQR